MRSLQLIVFSLVCSSQLAFAQEEIQLATSKQSNGMMSFLASTVLDMDCSRVLPVVLNRETYPLWWYNLEEARPLRDKSQAYWHGHAPWPVQDRDFISQDKITQDEKTLAVTYSAIAFNSDEVPVHPRRVRMDTVASRLTIAPQKESRCEVIIEVSAKPGGMIPQWAADLMASQTPKLSLSNLKRLIESKKPLPALAPDSFAATEMAKLKVMPK